MYYITLRSGNGYDANRKEKNFCKKFPCVHFSGKRLTEEKIHEVR